MDSNINAVENQSTTDFDAVPAELRILDQWVLWRYETRAEKPTKVPYDARKQKRA